MLENIDKVFWTKFFILWIPFVVIIFIFAPSLKWKFLFSVCGIVGIALALKGKSMRLHR
jgi:hypothetical protein